MNDWELLEIKLRAAAEIAWANYVQARETGNYGPANAWDDCSRALLDMADRIREAHTAPPILTEDDDIVADLFGDEPTFVDGRTV